MLLAYRIHSSKLKLHLWTTNTLAVRNDNSTEVYPSGSQAFSVHLFMFHKTQI